MTEKRFTLVSEIIETYPVAEIDYKKGKIELLDNGERMTYKSCCDLLNHLHEETQTLKRHIERSTFNKIRVEDVFNCAKYDKFYDNEEAIKSIDWIAEQLGVDLDD